MRRRTHCKEGKGLFIHKKTKQTNKNYPVGEKQTGWLGWAGQGWAGLGWAGQGWAGLDKAGQGWAGQGRAGLDKAGHRQHLTLGNEPTRNCKHKEIIKGANEEGNEGKQLGKINQ